MFKTNIRSNQRKAIASMAKTLSTVFPLTF